MPSVTVLPNSTAQLPNPMSVYNPAGAPNTSMVDGSQVYTPPPSIVVSSKASQSQTIQNSGKLDNAIAGVSGVKPTDTSNPLVKRDESNVVGPTVSNPDNPGTGQKWAYRQDGQRMSIPAGDDPAYYGWSANSPTEATNKDGNHTPAPDPSKTGASGSMDSTTQAYNDYLTMKKTEIEDAKAKNLQLSANADATTAALIQGINATYDARIKKMEDINMRYLQGKKVAGATSGRMEYASGIQQGILSTEELDGQARLGALDAERLQLIAQAKQARSELSVKMFNESMDRMDKNYAEQVDTITKLHSISVAADAALEAKRKALVDSQQTEMQNSLKTADGLAASVSSAMDGLKTDKEKQAYVDAVSKKYGVGADILLSSVQEYKTKDNKAKLDAQNVQSQINERGKKAVTETAGQKKTNGYSSINYLLSPEASANVVKAGGVPYVDQNGYLTPEGFKTLVSAAAEQGISRKEFLAEYGSQLFIPEGGASKYGLTALEAKQLAGATDGNVQVIDKAMIQDAFPNLDQDATMKKVEALRKAGQTEKEILKTLEAENSKA